MSAYSEIYIANDAVESRLALHQSLAVHGLTTTCFSSINVLLSSLPRLAPGIIASDANTWASAAANVKTALAHLRRCDPVIIIVEHYDMSFAVPERKRGAFDFIERPFTARAIQDVIERARIHAEAQQRHRSVLEFLSPRECQVLETIIAGMTTKEGACQLAVSPYTIQSYRARLLRKTGVSSCAELAKIAVELGFGRDICREKMAAPA